MVSSIAAPPPLPGAEAGGTFRGWALFLRRFARIAGPYWRSENRWRIRGLTAALIVLTAGQVLAVVAINKWTERLFDALEHRSLDRFLVLVGFFVTIIAGNAAVVTLHLMVKRRLQIGWRDWLTARLAESWMSAGRHYQITLMPGDYDNPDGRIAEDVRISTEHAIELGHSLLYCCILLISFTHILWTLSGPPDALSLYVPGHLVWVALIYAGGGTIITLLLGRPLVRAANLRQAAEASFRFGLAHARENALPIALQRGEGQERRHFTRLFTALVGAWNRQTTALACLFLFTTSWSVLSLVFPVMVAAPRYILGAITLGVLMQTAQAFQQMVAALTWPIDNFARAAELRGSFERVYGLHSVLGALAGPVTPGIDHPLISRADRPILAFRDFDLADPDGRVVIAGLDAEIAAGDRVLIAGEPGATVNLFKAVIGLWPWGRGSIELPSEGRIFIMPQRPYLPVGRLRTAVCYPTGPSLCGDPAIRDALARVGLEHLANRLDDEAQWDQVLSAGEAQRLGIARLLLHRPDWILIQEAIDALDAAGEVEMLRLLHEEFPAATIITIGHRPALDSFYRRVFNVRRVDGVAILEETGRTAADAPAAGSPG